LNYCFPNDKSVVRGNYKLYALRLSNHNEWHSYDIDELTLPTQSVKVFLKEIELEEAKIKGDKGVNIGFESKSSNDLKLESLKHSLKDNINPEHYKKLPRETIQRIQDSLTPEEFKGYLKGNIFKYIARYENKNGCEDLNKAKWYLEKLIEVTSESIK